MSRRSRSLVDQQLALIDGLERNEDDPERLDSLFRLDHLAARMRRNGANLLVLSGAQLSSRAVASRVPLADVHQGRRRPRSRTISASRSATVPDSAIARSAGRRRRAPARRVDRQRAALLAAERRRCGCPRRTPATPWPGRRGQRRRARHDRGRPADRQHAAGVRRRGHPRQHPPHGSVRGRPARCPARPGGAAAQLGGRGAALRHDRRASTSRRTARARHADRRRRRRYDAPSAAPGEHDAVSAAPSPQVVDPARSSARAAAAPLAGLQRDRRRTPPQPNPAARRNGSRSAEEAAPAREHPADTVAVLHVRARAAAGPQENIDVSDIGRARRRPSAPEPARATPTPT